MTVFEFRNLEKQNKLCSILSYTFFRFLLELLIASVRLNLATSARHLTPKA